MLAFIYSCDLAAGNAIDLADGIDTSGFPIEMGTAQFGAWASWACWVGLTVFAVLKLCRYHQLENMRVSMYRERQRLINGNGSSVGQENKIDRQGETEGTSQAQEGGGDRSFASSAPA